MGEKTFFRVTVAGVIFNREKKVLLAKRSIHDAVLPGFWGLPGGNIEAKGNISNILESELKREVQEEVGIDVKNLKYLESHLNESGKLNICFTAEADKGEPKALDETDKIGWFTLKQAEKMNLTPHTLERLNLAWASLVG